MLRMLGGLISSGSAEEPKSTSSSQLTGMSYNIIGDFEGDDIKKAKADDLQKRLLSPKADEVGVEEMAEFLDSLPFNGRLEFVIHVLGQSPARDSLVLGLFDWCFMGDEEGSDDDGFVMMGCGGTSYLNTQRYPIMRCVLSLLGKAEDLAIELFEKYRKTTSTIFRTTFLQAMANNSLFSNARLEETYLTSVENDKKAIIECCKKNPLRADLIAKLVKSGKLDSSFIVYAPSSYVQSCLAAEKFDHTSYKRLLTVGLQNWKAHSEIYLEFLKELFEKYNNDPLGKGLVFRAFERQLTEKLSPEYALEIFKLIDTYSPLEVVGRDQGIKEYLTRISKAGKLTRRYESVALALPNGQITGGLPAPVKFRLFKELLIETETGIVFRDTHVSFCQSFLSLSPKRFRKSLNDQMAPHVKKCLEKISVLEFWRTLVPVHGTPLSPVGVAYSAVKSYIQKNLTPKKIIQSIELLGFWISLYSRVAPTPELMKELGLSKGAMSDRWLSSFLEPILPHLAKTAEKASRVLASESMKLNRSSITCYVGFTSLLLSFVRDSLTLESLTCSSGLLLKSVNNAVAAAARVCDSFKGDLLPPASSPGNCEKKMAALKGIMQELLFLTLKVTDGSISAHPGDEGYADMTRLSELRGSLFNLFTESQLARFASVREKTFEFCIRLRERLELGDDRLGDGFVEVIGEDSKVRLSPFNINYHTQYVGLSSDLLQNVLSSYSKAPEDALATKVWSVIKAQKFKTPNHINASAYVQAVSNLPKRAQELERSSLLTLGASLFSEKKLTNSLASLYARIGLLEEVVNSNPENTSTKNLLLELYGDIQIEGVRNLLEEKTRDRDANMRMDAHCTLLNRSLNSFAEVATSLSYVQERIKNEAGLYRPTVYSWVTRSIQSVVALSIDKESSLADVKKCTQALVKMLRNDVSKRDSVAKNTFLTVAGHMMDKALTHNNGRCCYEVREEWVNGAMLLQWTVKKTILGDEGWQSLEWPLRARFPTTHIMAEESLEGVFKEAFDKYYRNGTYFRTLLKKSVFSKGMQIHSSDVFSPEMAVRIVLNSLFTVQSSQLDGNDKENQEWLKRGGDELTEGKFFPKYGQGKAVSMTKIRMELLFKFAHTLWTHVPQLVSFLEKITDGLAYENRNHTLYHAHFYQASALFWSIKSQYPCESVWYEVTPLRNLSRALFAAAVQLKLHESSKYLTVWKEEREGFGKADLSILSLNQIQFIATNCGSLHTMHLEKKSDKERKCKMVRLALDLCPSAIHLLSSDLISVRDDILGKYLGTPRSKCTGVFDPQYFKSTSEKELAKPFRLALTSQQVASLGRATLGCHTRLALDDAMDVSKSPGVRSRAIAQFVESPVSGHQEIIDLLKRLLANRSEEDGALDVLLETVILSVFSTDATWFVLAYLLSPDVISTSPQRTTASILTQMKKWIPVAKVVGVVRILLEPRRRWALKLFLFKSILRLLFDCNIEEGAKVFLSEWENRYQTEMHKDLQYEMVKLSVEALSSNSPISAVAWKVVESVASDPKASDDLLLLLVTLRWAPRSTFNTQKSVIASYSIPHKQEKGEFLKACSARSSLSVVMFADEKIAARVKHLLDLVQQTHPKSPVSTLAFVHQFTLSRAVVGEEDNDSVNALHALLVDETTKLEGKAISLTDLETLSPPLETLPEATHYLIQTVPGIYVGLLLQVLNKKIQDGYPNVLRNSDKPFSELSSHDYAAQLSQLVSSLLTTLASTAPLEVEKRARVSEVLKLLIAGMKSSHAMWFKHLVSEPSKNLLRFLGQEKDLLQKALM